MKQRVARRLRESLASLRCCMALQAWGSETEFFYVARHSAFGFPLKGWIRGGGASGLVPRICAVLRSDWISQGQVEQTMGTPNLEELMRTAYGMDVECPLSLLSVGRH